MMHYVIADRLPYMLRDRFQSWIRHKELTLELLEHLSTLVTTINIAEMEAVNIYSVSNRHRVSGNIFPLYFL